MELILNDISKSFNREPIIQNLYLKVESGTTVGIVGENGSGKSTLLKIIAGIIWPENGFGFLNEKPIFNREPGVRSQLIYWGHNPDLYQNMTAYENLNLFLNLRGESRKIKIINEAINSVKLGEAFNKTIAEYSEGMIQRYHIARFKLSIWKFGVFDEPTNGLDEDGIEVLNEAFKEFKEKRKTLLISSHDQNFLKTHCDKIYKMEDGKLVE